MLVAQAQLESLAIVSNDALLDGYGVSPDLVEIQPTDRSLPEFSPIAANPKPFYGLR